MSTRPSESPAGLIGVPTGAVQGVPPKPSSLTPPLQRLLPRDPADSHGNLPSGRQKCFSQQDKKPSPALPGLLGDITGWACGHGFRGHWVAAGAGLVSLNPSSQQGGWIYCSCLDTMSHRSDPKFPHPEHSGMTKKSQHMSSAHAGDFTAPSKGIPWGN